MVVLTSDELTHIIRGVISDEIGKRLDAKPPRPTIKGIHGLAEALNCSIAKAQKLKNSGQIPYFQNEKLLLFDFDQVMDALKGTDIHRRGRRPRHVEPERAVEIRRVNERS